MKLELITRKQYMNGEYSHDEYYGQWVSDAMMDYVVKSIGPNRILKSNDRHLNDIPLREWDRLSVMHFVNKENWIDSRLSTLTPEVYEANRLAHIKREFSYSLSDSVCVAKAAAKKYIESVKSENADEEVVSYHRFIVWILHLIFTKDCKELIRLLQKRIDMDNEKEGTNNE